MTDGTIGSPNAGQVPAVYRVRVGDIRVTALSDGFVKGAEGILRGVDRDVAKATLSAAHRSPAVVEVNAFVVESAGRRVLIDSGSGRHMGRNAGRLPAHLDAAGIDGASIDTVLLTHIHPDHVGGLIDVASGTARFPNAELVVHPADHAYWMDDAEMARAPEEGRSLFFGVPREQLRPYAGRLRLLAEGEVIPGLRVMQAPGHTPGHVVCLLSSGPDTLMIWGDTVHVPEVQTAFPDAGVVFDLDRAAAAATRRRVFDMVASDGIAVMGMHLGFPGLARLGRAGDGYRLVTLPWRHDLDGIP